MIDLGPPRKTIEYKGLKLKLYGSTTLARMLGKPYEAFLVWEKDGAIPKPMFKIGTRKYYSEFEVQAFAKTILKNGIPRFVRGVDNPFVTNLRESWKEVRGYILQGKYPPMPYRLEYKNKAEFLQSVKEALNVFGLRGEVQAERVAEVLSEKAVLI